MPAQSDLDIINLALGHLKQKPVTSITPPIQTAAKIAVKYYQDGILSALRRMRPWWAQKQIMLSAQPEQAAFGPAYIFPLPEDFVAIMKIGATLWENYTAEKELMADGLHLDDEGPLAFTYIFQQFDVSKFDSIFRLCASFSLAELMAYELTGNANLRQLMEEQADKLGADQRSINGQEAPVKRFQQSKFITARRRSATGGYTSS